MNDNKTPFTPVMGYLANNWVGLNERTPAVVLNPEARPLDVMAWCWAELESIRAAANALVTAGGDINNGEFSALILYRIEPLAGVFEEVVSQLLREAATQGRA